jgi:hypothetical protein
MQRPDTVDQSFVVDNNSASSWKNMSEDKVLILLNTPCNIIISSPSQGGKSTFVHRLLKHDMFRETPEKILYCYNSTWQPMFSTLESEMDNISFHYGIPNKDDLEKFQTISSRHSIIVFDDLMTDAMNTDTVLKLFTVGTHHNNCTVILLTHNLFLKSKHSRTLNLNTHVFVIMANNRDKGQITALGRQLGYRQLLQAYLTAAAEPYTYFIIDLHTKTDKNLRLRSAIFPDEGPTAVYKAE